MFYDDDDDDERQKKRTKIRLFYLYILCTQTRPFSNKYANKLHLRIRTRSGLDLDNIINVRNKCLHDYHMSVCVICIRLVYIFAHDLPIN